MFISRILFNVRGFCLRIIARFLNWKRFKVKKLKNRDGGICARWRRRRRVPVPFSVWKELSQLQGSLPALCSTGPREQGARRTDQNLAAGKRPRNKKNKKIGLSFFLSTPLLFFTSPLSSCSLPLGSGGGEAKAAPPAPRYVCF